MTSVLDLIGETPLIEVTQFGRGPCRLFLKLESANPSGSVKDRPAHAMIEAAVLTIRCGRFSCACEPRTVSHVDDGDRIAPG